ncbi:unnamed protein product [Didymodactylos carnosus]|uniref:Rap guanine nucleotide exchange factor 1 n=1 Tax=Didymodactylos carnosus TaxID=1234261 RepID=A0A814AFD9_9BILA|nr:unnamed protein product [Didymodactylos carnosus]CAF3692796.1 unnamed protein product [Didymodactylos carnosus]
MPQSSFERLRKTERELFKSLNYLEQVLTHNKLEILSSITTSLIENILDFDSVLKGIFENETELYRLSLLADVYSLLADLINWADKVLLNNLKVIDKTYEKIINDFKQAVKDAISIACENLSTQSVESRSDSFHSFGSTNSSDDDLAPTLPPKRRVRPVSCSSTTTTPSTNLTSKNTNGHKKSTNSLISTITLTSNQVLPEQQCTSLTPVREHYTLDDESSLKDDQRIQLIVNDINDIVEKYTKELEDALRQTKSMPNTDFLPPTHKSGSSSSLVHRNNTHFSSTSSRSPSSDNVVTLLTDEQSEKAVATINPLWSTLSYRRNSIDALSTTTDPSLKYETRISKMSKRTTLTTTTTMNGKRLEDKKESCQIYNEMECALASDKADYLANQRSLFIRNDKIHQPSIGYENQQTIQTNKTELKEIMRLNNNSHLTIENQRKTNAIIKGESSHLKTPETVTLVEGSCEGYKKTDSESTTSPTNGSKTPPLPPKRKTARAYMSLFDRYDENQAQAFLRDEFFLNQPPQRRFEDLFEQLHEHFREMNIFPSDESLKSSIRTEQQQIPSSLTHVTNGLPKNGIKQADNNSEHAQKNLNKYDIDTDVANQAEMELFLEDVSHLLVFNQKEDPSLRGGTVDALIIRATSPDKKDFIYQEAFLTTYRTFVKPQKLVEKLIQRYTFFFKCEAKKKIARYAISLLIRVIDEIDNELSDNMMTSLSLFVTNLIRNSELQLGKLLRRKSLERFLKRTQQNKTNIILIQNQISPKRSTLLDFHSNDIAEQMTLLDSELFLKISLPEILYMSIEKGEDYCPNLSYFTEHFNKMSYWVRSRILEQNSQRQRENYFEKFLKILKHLRRLNNFNSYLAILSALDCGPLKRLHWSKSIIESIAEHTVLIDSTGSFKNYREALLNSVGTPCIPYIGLILSDLTFVHIGNADYLPDGKTVNFWKRWQQFNILHKLRYCRKWEHKFERCDRILFFFNNFDDYMSEDSQWLQSEKIKPRSKANPYG